MSLYTAEQRAGAKSRRIERNERVIALCVRILALVTLCPGLTVEELYRKFPPAGAIQWDLRAALDIMTGYKCQFHSGGSTVTRTGRVEIQKDRHGERRLVLRAGSEESQPMSERPNLNVYLRSDR